MSQSDRIVKERAKQLGTAAEEDQRNMNGDQVIDID